MKKWIVIMVLFLSGCASTQKIADECGYRVDTSLSTEEIFSKPGLVDLYTRVNGHPPPEGYDTFGLARGAMTESGSVDVFKVMYNINYDGMIHDGASEGSAAWTAKMAGKSYRSNAWGAGYDKSVCPRQKELTNQAALIQ